MQRARRLASIAVIAVVGVLALSGCRSEPGVAAYVGDLRITEDEVTRIVDQVRPTPPPGGPSTVDPGARPAATAGGQANDPARKQVVSVLVLGEICARISADEGYQAQDQVAPEQVAQALGVAPDSDYAQRTAQLYTCLSGVRASAPVVPTEADLADVVARGRAAGVIPADVTDEQAAAQLDGDQLRSALASRKLLADAVSRYDVTVNPRYRPMEFPVLSYQGNAAAVVVPLGEGDPGTVIDQR